MRRAIESRLLALESKERRPALCIFRQEPRGSATYCRLTPADATGRHYGRGQALAEADATGATCILVQYGQVTHE